MEETTNIWNKTTAELTVKDQLIVAAVAPIIVIGALAAAGAVMTVGEKIVRKFRKSTPDLTIVTNEEN